MAELTAASFGELIAERIWTGHREIAGRWLERLRAMLPVGENEIFPSDQLLDHIPVLVREIAEYLRSPEDLAVAANTAVTQKARELGSLRHQQRASVHQLLGEYRILGGILASFVSEQIETLGLTPSAPEVIAVFRRLQEATWLLEQVTVDTFVSDYTAALERSTTRVERFHRLVSHELRQPLATLQYAVPLLRAKLGPGDAPQVDRLVDVVERNVVRLMELTETLAAVTRADERIDGLSVQHLELGAVACEVARQLREMAEARGVEIRVADDLPTVVADAARVELILVNLVSNAIKYSDPAKPSRTVSIHRADAESGMHAIAVQDNGLGIAESDREQIFRRFTRAHADRDVELGVDGLGLGLSIVADSAEALGGSVRVESTVGVGATFVLLLPATE